MSSAYLLKKSDTYYARFRVPDRHRKLLQRTEFKWSLCSNRKIEARARSAFFRNLVVQVFSMLDELLPYTLTDAEERTIRIGLKRYLEDKIIAYRDVVERAASGEFQALKAELHEDSPRIQTLKSALKSGAYDDPWVVGAISQFLEFCPDRMAMYFDDPNPDYRFLARLGCQTELRLHQGKLHLLQGEVNTLASPQLSRSQPVQPPQAQAPEQHPTTKKLLLREAINLYLVEQSDHELQGKSIQDYGTALRRFREFLGDPALEDIGRDDIKNFRAALAKFPQRQPNALRGVDFNKVIKLQHDRCLSKDTINKHLNRISSFFRWAIREELYPKNNPAEALEYRASARANEKRKRFSPEDLRRIFSLDTFQGKKKISKSAHYWAPLLSLYGGFRIEEICQLDSKDVFEEDSVWVVSINDNGDKKVKSASAVRTIPLHPQLIKLGFIDYVAAIDRAKHKKLFPSLTKHRDNGYSHNVGRWFGRQKDSLGFEKLTQTFHSFRHTVSDELKQKRVPEVIIAAIVGHEHGGITNNRYGKAYEPAVLLTEIEKLCFDIDVVKFSENLLTDKERDFTRNRRKSRT